MNLLERLELVDWEKEKASQSSEQLEFLRNRRKKPDRVDLVLGDIKSNIYHLTPIKKGNS